MSPEHVRTIFDALEFRENELLNRLDREPKTRNGKPNPMRPWLHKDLSDIADARLAFRNAFVAA
jgi:hypothetical protein